MHRDPRLYLDDILEAIAQIQEYTDGFDYDMFKKDRRTQDAVVRNLEIIGEAAGRLPESLKTSTTGVSGDLKLLFFWRIENALSY